MLFEEIRINKKYASVYESEYEGDSLDKTSEPIIREKLLPTNKYLKKLASQATRDHILPPNTRYHEKFTNGDLFVIEEPPSMRTILVDADMWGVYQRLKAEGKDEEYGINDEWFEQNHRPYRFNLAFPYTVFVISVSNGQAMTTSVFFRTKELVGLSDYVLMAPLYNIPDNQVLCLGSEGGNRYTSPTAVAINAINVFWGATFCPDYTYNVQKYQDVPGVCDLFTWQHLSQTNPMFIFTVHWLQHTDTLNKYLQNIKQGWNLVRSYEMMNYKSIKNVFTQPEQTGIEKKIGRHGNPIPLYADIANGLYLNGSEQLNIGDTVTLFNGEKSVVTSFLGNRDGDAVTHMNILINGEEKLLKLSPKFKKYIYDKLVEERYVEEAEIQDGQTLKPNDIIKVVNKMGVEIFKKVKYIRKAADDQLEVLLGTDYYLASAIKTVDKLDIEKPEIGNIQLEKDKEYFLYTRGLRAQPFREANIASFDSLDVNDNGAIMAKFKILRNGHEDFRNVKIDNDRTRSTHRVVPMEGNVRTLPPIYRLGRKVWGIYDDGGLAQDSVFATNDGVVYLSNRYNDTPGMDAIFDSLVNENKFKIESFDYNIEFEIGDYVVTSNWQDPNDMLSVKQIEGFKQTYDESNGRGTIDFVLKSKDGSLSTFPYISNNRIIQVGRIRKATTKLNDLETGMKIVATESGISNFPKKDVNIIVAFIIDGGHEPLVLCSNACTLWLSDVEEKFKIIPRSSDEWEKLQHAPIEIGKIKVQPGDMLKSTGYDYHSSQGYTVYRNYDNRGLRVHPNEYYHNHPENFTYDRYFKDNAIFDCILLPRLTQKQQDDLGVVGAYPNFLGAFTLSNSAQFYFLNEGRTIINNV